MGWEKSRIHSSAKVREQVQIKRRGNGHRPPERAGRPPRNHRAREARPWQPAGPHRVTHGGSRFSTKRTRKRSQLRPTVPSLASSLSLGRELTCGHNVAVPYRDITVPRDPCNTTEGEDSLLSRGDGKRDGGARPCPGGLQHNVDVIAAGLPQKLWKVEVEAAAPPK